MTIRNKINFLAAVTTLVGGGVLAKQAFAQVTGPANPDPYCCTSTSGNACCGPNEAMCWDKGAICR
jgi:subtilase family serine protease